ncbi:hypothetical protein J6P92_01830 [bacterium]|nr:hypothetical protein [bacterium]
MEISPYLNIYSQRKYPSFGDKYPARDIMCIMSGSEVIGKRSDTFDRTVAGVLQKHISSTVEERGKDYLHAQQYLYEKYPDLRKLAVKFRNMLNSVSYNHFSITTEDEKLICSNFENQIGSKFFDIN